MKKCLWLSRHAPLPAQREFLEREGFAIRQVVDTWRSAQEIANRLKEERADLAVIVAPLSLISALLPLVDIPILRADMEVICQSGCDCKVDPDREVKAMGRHYRFSHFSRLVRVVVETERWPSTTA